jgi:ketosteroid isomerase-like protein
MDAMHELLPRYKLLWEPAGTGRNAQRTEAYGDWYAESIHSFLPGTWVIAGHHYGRPNILKLLAAVKKVWTERSVFHNNNYWVGTDTICTEWFSTNGVWNGRRCRNSGLTRQTFAGGKVTEWQEYTDSEFFDEVHAGWRDAVGAELGAHLAKYAQRARWYSDPAQNEWDLDTSTSDGRDCAPEAMRANLGAAMRWWADPRQGMPELFAEDIRMRVQGRLWPLGGEHRGRAALERVFAAARAIWPRPAEIVKTELWANDDSVLIHWFTRSRTWNGQDCRASGWSVWKFRAEQVVEWRNYLNTSFYAEVHRGWREALGPELGAQLPNWVEPRSPRYPDPMQHE